MNKIKKNTLDNYIIRGDETIQDALKRFETNGEGIVFVVDFKQRLIGSLTDGDVRRALLKGKSLLVKLKFIANPNPYSLNEKSISLDVKLQKNLVNLNIRYIPILSEANKIIKIIQLTDDIFQLQPKKLKRNKILVVGGAGYIGSVLIRKLLNEGHKVKVLDALLYGDASIKDLYKHQNFELIIGDSRNLMLVESVLKDCEMVVHLGEIVGDQACALDVDYTLSVNLIGTQNLIATANRFHLKKFIYMSSCSVYGFGKYPFSETSRPNPLSLYAKTKLECEKMILSKQYQNVNSTILRLSTVFGWSFRPRFDLVVNAFAYQAFFTKKIHVDGGQQWRPFIHVSDVAECILKVIRDSNIKTKNKVFNVGGINLNIQIKKLTEYIKSVFPKCVIIKNNKKEDNRSYRVSFEKINKELQFTPQKSIEFGLVEIKKELGKHKNTRSLFVAGNNFNNLIQE